MKITVRSQIENGSTRWVLDYTPEGGKRVRRFFRSKADADAAAKEQQTMVRRAGEDWLALSTAERADLITAYAQVKALGMTMHQVLEQWRAGTNAQKQEDPLATVTLRDALDQWLEGLRTKNARPRYIENCTGFAARFARGREQQPVSQIGLPEIKAWLAAGDGENGPYTGWTYNTYRDRLRSFYSHCATHNLVSESPIDGKKLPKQQIDFVHPSCFTPAQVRQALQWIVTNDTDLLAWFVLATFQGTRPEELDRLSWEQIDLDRGLMRVEASQAKDRRPRLNHLHPTCVAWLRVAREHNSPLGWDTYARLRRMTPLRVALGFTEWPHDICRHTFGSYYTELFHDVAKTSLEMGNSPKIVLRNYRELVTPEACAEFWALTPESVLATATK